MLDMVLQVNSIVEWSCLQVQNGKVQKTIVVNFNRKIVGEDTMNTASWFGNTQKWVFQGAHKVGYNWMNFTYSNYALHDKYCSVDLNKHFL